MRIAVPLKIFQLLNATIVEKLSTLQEPHGTGMEVMELQRSTMLCDI